MRPQTDLPLNINMDSPNPGMWEQLPKEAFPGYEKFHPLASSSESLSLPLKFTNPFGYVPHPLCVKAAGEVQAYILSRKQWEEELKSGKMFGVLVVEALPGTVGYLAAFSGNLAGRNHHSFFVPPVYDFLQPDGYFCTEEANISVLNLRIGQMEDAEAYLSGKAKHAQASAQAALELDEAKARIKQARQEREERRRHQPDETEQAAMVRESQHQKAELKRLERTWKERLGLLQAGLQAVETEIDVLKSERKRRSAALQQWLFEQFELLNARGEKQNLCDLFHTTASKTPPAGAGECAAPKLLQYAYRKGLKPLAMAEFWWGGSPTTEVRHQGYYYPACKGKCEPILKHMLQGLDVEAPRLPQNEAGGLDILWEDQWLLAVCKPPGLLSVPGKDICDSVYERVKKLYPSATGALVVHRLDMATSGVLLIAKTKEVHKKLQQQFKDRSVKKKYVAWLDGHLSVDEGKIELPLCLDPLDRPRQVVHETYGKPAVTLFRVLERTSGRTRIAFFPLTGRTHQLRVHAAHVLGLGCPIVGDPLYGQAAERLFLHAEALEFRHPVSGEIIRVEKKADF